MELVNKIDSATINNQYKVIFENSPLGIFHYTKDGIITQCNQKLADIVGLSKDKLIGVNLFDIVAESCVLNTIKEGLLKDTSFYEGEYITATSGKSIYLRLNINRICDKNNCVVGAVAIFEDLSPQIKHDNEFRMLSELTDKCPVSVIITDKDNKIIYANRCFSVISGYSFCEVEGKDPSFLGSELNSKYLYDELWSSLEDKGIWEGIFVNKKRNGSLYYEKAKIMCIRDGIGKVTNYVALKEDISFSIESEEKLRISESNFRNLLDNAGDMIMVISEGSCLFVNKELTKRSGYSREEFHNNHFLNFIHPEDRHIIKQNYYSRLAGKTLSDNYKIKALVKNGEIRNIDINVKETVFNGKPSIITIMRDITEKLLMEKELLEAKNKAEENEKLKANFLANISHELRTPLNHVIGFSNLLEDEDINKTAKAYSKMIYNSSIRMLSIIEDIFTFIGLEQGDVSCFNQKVTLFYLFDINKVKLKKILSTSNKKERIELKFRPDPKFFNREFSIDIHKVDIVLKNIFKNAVKFTETGNIEFGFDVCEDKELIFFVKDTGVGIPDSKRDIIFDYFRRVEEDITRNYGGVGLGLSISKKMAESLNGDIFFKSNDTGCGTIFYFKLPLGIN